MINVHDVQNSKATLKVLCIGHTNGSLWLESEETSRRSDTKMISGASSSPHNQTPRELEIKTIPILHWIHSHIC